MFSPHLNNGYDSKNFSINYYYFPIIGNYTTQKVVAYVGQRDINYHFKSDRKFIAFKQSGSTNSAYNFSYLTIKELIPALWACVLSVFIAVKNIFFW